MVVYFLVVIPFFLLNTVCISSENCAVINGRVRPFVPESNITPDIVIDIIKEGTSQSCYLKCSQNLVCELVHKRTDGQISCTYTKPNKYFITSSKYQFGYKHNDLSCLRECFPNEFCIDLFKEAAICISHTNLSNYITDNKLTRVFARENDAYSNLTDSDLKSKSVISSNFYFEAGRNLTVFAIAVYFSSPFKPITVFLTDDSLTTVYHTVSMTNNCPIQYVQINKNGSVLAISLDEISSSIAEVIVFEKVEDLSECLTSEQRDSYLNDSAYNSAYDNLETFPSIIVDKNNLTSFIMKTESQRYMPWFMSDLVNITEIDFVMVSGMFNNSYLLIGEYDSVIDDYVFRPVSKISSCETVKINVNATLRYVKISEWTNDLTVQDIWVMTKL